MFCESINTFGLAKTDNMILKNILWKEGKYFVAQCLNVDVSSFGKTKTEAIKNLDEALELYFEDNKSKKPVKVLRAEVVSSRVKYA